MENSYNKNNFDIIVIGAGHAGVEASLVCARRGLSTLLVTTNLSRISYMSCNPSIGGLAKGHMVRELDILGGEMALLADASCIQFKRLNSSKGAAVQGSRVQCDKDIYSRLASVAIHTTKHLSILEAEVKELILGKTDNCLGVVLSDGSRIFSRSTIITAGTFLNGVMHIGFKQIRGGRVGDAAAVGLSDQLKARGLVVKRLKTGTPARLLKDSIHWDKTTVQWGDETPYPLSHRSPRRFQLEQVACFLSHTNERTHEIIRSNLDKSPMYCGLIEGVGPRYCPSIEDKVVRFSERASHQTFLEPEGLNSNSIYLQGISTSLPEEVQDQFLRTIPGLEDVAILKYGYAVEYDFFDPLQISSTLESKGIENLYFAGQVNGTSGYEEAAAQGLIAGINAANKIFNRAPFVLGRDEAYIGVMIDDLVTKGTEEPYRMFTSRAEYRLLLREDNTIERLSRKAEELSVLPLDVLASYRALQSKQIELRQFLSETRIFPSEDTQVIFKKWREPVPSKPLSFEELLRRPSCSSSILEEFIVGKERSDLFVPEIFYPVEVEIKYEGYIKKQREMIQQLRKLENVSIPNSFDYSTLQGLSAEEVEKLKKVRPQTLAQAQRISGVNPSALQLIMLRLKH